MFQIASSLRFLQIKDRSDDSLTFRSESDCLRERVREKAQESVEGLKCNPQRQRDGVRLMRESGLEMGRGAALAADGQLCVPLTSV